ncbi:hypothetical protein STIAU_4721 [Stigmatella aurantiaca DW4/3-1]|uniref:Uncharacterized protein n=1 Tax=Stigmatella aurantiaca (strain DW4/3-1) TaxID=378806 RepID=Q08SH6_STIAD|nr:hypothetical protein STIAU_4721 [Stigmatella aurantiaca DW4/3-1]
MVSGATRAAQAVIHCNACITRPALLLRPEAF